MHGFHHHEGCGCGWQGEYEHQHHGHGPFECRHGGPYHEGVGWGWEGGHEHHHHGACRHGWPFYGAEQPSGFRRRFRSRSEVIGELEAYLKELEAEAQGVREKLERLRSMGSSPQQG